jgi:catechol 2,3-dioxygenase
MPHSSITNHESTVAPSPIVSVELLTADILHAAAFYSTGLGFLQAIREDGSYAFTAQTGGPPLIILRENRTAARRARRSAGLYHIALRVPSRAELGRLLSRLLIRGIPLHGGADHGVSEALYLADFDGNGIELYADRPATEWKFDGNQVAMVSEVLDQQDLRAAAGTHPIIETPIHPDTIVGHVHLRVTSLTEAEHFYANVLGMDITQQSFPGALFLSYGGYHHHIGVNVWESLAGSPLTSNHIGLLGVTVALPSEAFHRVLASAQNRTLHIDDRRPASFVLHDGDGIRFHISNEQSHIHSSNIHKVHYA